MMLRILLPALLAFHTIAGATVLQPGADLPQINLKDQHEKPLPIPRETRLVFFSSEMDGSRLMTKALDALPATTLKDKGAVYIADISGMPAVIATIVAMPRLQKAPYKVALIRDEKDGAALPRKPGTVTVLTVDGGKVSTINFVSELQQIHRHLK